MKLTHRLRSVFTFQRREVVLLTLIVAGGVRVLADTAPRWSDAELLRFSEVVVTGRVSDIISAHDDAVGAIYSYVTIDITEVLKGDIDDRQIVLKQLGGEVDGRGMSVGGQAAFTFGEETLLFLEVRPRDRSLYTTAFWQGKWIIERDPQTRETIAVRPNPVRADHGVFRETLDRRPLAAMESQISAAAAGRPKRADAPALNLKPDAERWMTTPRDSISRPLVLFSPPWRWTEFDSRIPIPVDIMSNGQPGLPGGGGAEIAAAASIWAAATPLLFAAGGDTSRCFQGLPFDGHISVVFMDPCGEVSDSGSTYALGGAHYSFGGGGTVGGIAFNKAVAGYVINNDSATAVSVLQNSSCFQATETHELGHVFGLDHTTDPNAIMNPVIADSCFSSRTPLGSDDVAAIQSVYPPGSLPAATPGAPSNLSASSSGSTVMLSWTAPASGGVPTAYTIEAGSTIGAANLANFSTGNTAATFSATGVGAGTYYVRVRATNAAGTSAPSNEATLVVGQGCTAPGAPAGFGAVFTGNGMVVLSWVAAAGTPASYIVEAGSGPGLSNLANADLGTAGTSYTAVNVGSGRYYVRLRARNSCGIGTSSNEVVLVVP